MGTKVRVLDKAETPKIQYKPSAHRYGTPAEEAVIEHLRSGGRTSSGVREHPNGVYYEDMDLYSTKRHYTEKIIEVERRSPWVNRRFPFDTIHIPKRRWDKTYDEIWVVSGNLCWAYVITQQQVDAAPAETVWTKRGRDEFKNVPVEDAKFVKLNGGIDGD